MAPYAHRPSLTLCVGKSLCCDFPLDQHTQEGEDRPHPQDDPGEPAHWLLWCHLQVKRRGRYLGNEFISQGLPEMTGRPTCTDSGQGQHDDDDDDDDATAAHKHAAPPTLSLS